MIFKHICNIVGTNSKALCEEWITKPSKLMNIE